MAVMYTYPYTMGQVSLDVLRQNNGFCRVLASIQRRNIFRNVKKTCQGKFDSLPTYLKISKNA